MNKKVSSKNKSHKLNNYKSYHSFCTHRKNLVVCADSNSLMARYALGDKYVMDVVQHDIPHLFGKLLSCTYSQKTIGILNVGRGVFHTISEDDRHLECGARCFPHTLNKTIGILNVGRGVFHTLSEDDRHLECGAWCFTNTLRRRQAS